MPSNPQPITSAVMVWYGKVPTMTTHSPTNTCLLGQYHPSAGLSPSYEPTLSISPSRTTTPYDAHLLPAVWLAVDGEVGVHRHSGGQALGAAQVWRHRHVTRSGSGERLILSSAGSSCLRN